MRLPPASRIGDSPARPAPLGVAFEWLHAFALGGYPDWDDKTMEPGASVVHSIRYHSAQLWKLAGGFRPDSGLLKHRLSPHKPADAEKIVAESLNAIESLRTLARRVVLDARDCPANREAIADAASLALATGEIVAMAYGQFFDAYTGRGRSGHDVSRKGGFGRRGKSAKATPEIRADFVRRLKATYQLKPSQRPSYPTAVRSAQRQSGMTLVKFDRAWRIGKEEGLSW